MDPAKQSPVKGAGGLVQVQKLMYALGRAKPLVRARVGASHSDGLLQWIGGGGQADSWTLAEVDSENYLLHTHALPRPVFQSC